MITIIKKYYLTRGNKHNESNCYGVIFMNKRVAVDLRKTWQQTRYPRTRYLKYKIRFGNCTCAFFVYLDRRQSVTRRRTSRPSERNSFQTRSTFDHFYRRSADVSSHLRRATPYKSLLSRNARRSSNATTLQVKYDTIISDT